MAFPSVFTHLDAEDSDAWLGHAAAAIGGRGFIWSTWFIVDDEAAGACRAGQTKIGFMHEESGVFWQTADRELGAVAYAPWKLRELFARHSLEPVHQEFRTWCPRSPSGGGVQDLIVLRGRRQGDPGRTGHGAPGRSRTPRGGNDDRPSC